MFAFVTRNKIINGNSSEQPVSHFFPSLNHALDTLSTNFLASSIHVCPENLYLSSMESVWKTIIVSLLFLYFLVEEKKLYLRAGFLKNKIVFGH